MDPVPPPPPAPADHGAAAARGYVDTATDCAICLSPLADAETLTLTCGHVWHVHCVKAQLRHAAPSPSRRLLLSGARCAKCGVFCDHPALADAARASAALRAAVDALVAAQAAVDNLAAHPAAAPGARFAGDPLALGRALYAFFLCAVCGKPYFGGTVACADAADDVLPPGDRMCPACSPATSVVCAHSAHTAFHVWKCRYCCRSAEFVCYGTTHFCRRCHERNSAPARHGPLSPVECPGRPACATPLRPGQERHANGATHDCEQILRCTLCASDPTGVGVRVDLARMSPNMVFNPSAALGMDGWTRYPQLRPWEVERSEVPFRAQPSNFVSSFSLCAMAQVVPLARFLTRPGSARIEVSARYMARTDCPSKFSLEAAMYSPELTELARFSSGALSAPADFWEPVKHIFAPHALAAYVVIAVKGRDERVWSGNYGSKVTDISVRCVLPDSGASDDGMIVTSAFEGGFESALRSPEVASVLERFLPERRGSRVFARAFLH